MSVERCRIVEFACITEICVETMESPLHISVSYKGTPMSDISPQVSLGSANMSAFAKTNGLLLAWNALSVVAVTWMVLNFWKLILFAMAAGGVGFFLVTAILSPVLTFAIKITGFVKNNLRFVVLISWRGMSIRSVELSPKVNRGF